MASNKDKIITRIHRWGGGAAFTPKDFLDLASRGTVDMTLAALLADGTIRRRARGLYDYPRQSRLLETPASPDLDEVARALASRLWCMRRSTGWSALRSDDPAPAGDLVRQPGAAGYCPSYGMQFRSGYQKRPDCDAFVALFLGRPA